MLHIVTLFRYMYLENIATTLAQGAQGLMDNMVLHLRCVKCLKIILWQAGVLPLEMETFVLMRATVDVLPGHSPSM